MRTCMCADSSGWYTDMIRAEINGPCVALGFDNRELYDALHADLDAAEKGVEFLAFVIPNNAISISRKRMEKNEVNQI